MSPSKLENLTTYGLPLSPKQLQAIGMVAVQWAMLEHHFDILLRKLMDPNDTASMKVAKEGSSRARFNLLKDTLRADHGDNSRTAALIAVIDDALSVKGQRGKIIHNVYGFEDGSGSLVLFNWLDKKKSRLET